MGEGQMEIRYEYWPKGELVTVESTRNLNDSIESS